MKKDKDAGDGRKRGEPTTIDRLKELTRKVLAVPKSEIDERERAAAKLRQGIR